MRSIVIRIRRSDRIPPVTRDGGGTYARRERRRTAHSFVRGQPNRESDERPTFTAYDPVGSSVGALRERSVANNSSLVAKGLPTAGPCQVMSVMPDRPVRAITWGIVTGSKGGGVALRGHSRFRKPIRLVGRIRDFVSKVRAPRETGRDETIVSRGVLTVPL